MYPNPDIFFLFDPLGTPWYVRFRDNCKFVTFFKSRNLERVNHIIFCCAAFWNSVSKQVNLAIDLTKFDNLLKYTV